MVRTIVWAAAVMLDFSGAFGQSFEVASVKRNKSGDQSGRTLLEPGGRLRAVNVTLRQLLVRAYQVQDFQIVGGPGWVNSDRFDIDAKAAGEATSEAMNAMLRSLLADRFRLAVHRETRDLPVYALVMARSDKRLGPKLTPSKVDCDAVAEEAISRGGAPPPVKAGESPPCSIGFSGLGQMSARSKTMADVVRVFSQLTQHVVIDGTGLKGGFDFDLNWTPDEAPADAGGPSIFTSVQEQLGLKLESRKAPLEALVVDRIEGPSKN
jgi:uncharacterized protein (TIGR03435 family)